MSKTVKAHLAVLIANIIYGANYSIAKQVMPEYIKPFGFILIRVLVAGILFWICERLFIKEKVAKQDYKILFLCALFGVAINQLLFFKGLSLTSPINSGLMMISNPIFVLLLAAIIIKERIAWVRIGGIALGISGCVLLLLFSNKIQNTNSSTLGDLYVLINSLSFALYLVLVKPLMKIYHPITIMKWVFLFGIFWILPFGWKEMLSVDYSQIPTSAILAILYVIIFTTFLAYWLNNLALKTVEPSIVGIYIYLQPLLASFFAIILGKDFIDGTKIVSALLIFAGVYLASFYKHKTIYEKS